MANQYNFQKMAQINVKSTQAEAAMGRLSRQAIPQHRNSGKWIKKLADALSQIGESLKATAEKERDLNSRSA